MQLEKATSRSGQASLAGWISSNDVTLFTTVLVMAIAMYLHARVTNGAKENARIRDEKATLAASLDATTDELSTSKDLLHETRKTLHLTQDERDRLQHQLVEKLDAIVRLNNNLDALLKKKQLLESEQKSLTVVRDSLAKEKSELAALHVSLTGDRDALKVKNTSLKERLDEIASQLAAKIAALEQVEQERDQLQKQTDELDAIIGELKRRMKKLDIDLSSAHTSAAAAERESQTQVRELETKLAARDKTIDEYLARLKRATEMFEGLTAEKKKLQHALSESELKHQAELLEEGRNNRELIGLTGRLERVAILFDASGSMRQTTKAGNDRWAEAQQIAARWLQHLNINQCVLIVFSSDVQVFPANGTLADVGGPSGKAKREELLARLNAVSPGGATNTLEALRKAYQYDVDAILLFTDGAPSMSTSGVF